jgi:hypothetical protein
VLSWLALFAWAAVTFFASAATGSTMAAAGIGFVALVVLSLVAIVPALDRILPTGLAAPAVALGAGVPLADPARLASAVVGTAVLVVGAALAAHLAFRGRDL